MNDERSVFGNEEMNTEVSHASLDFNGERKLEQGLVSPNPRSDDVGVDGEEKKKFGFVNKSKSIEMDRDSDDDDSDDDNEPIGLLFKFKKLNNTKRKRNGSDEEGVGVMPENLRVGDKDSGAMDDTLASFRKKLKAPKMFKDGESGVVADKDSGLNGVGPSNQSSNVSDCPAYEQLGKPKFRGKRSCLSLTKKKKKMEDSSEIYGGLDQTPSPRRSHSTYLKEPKLGFRRISVCNNPSNESLEDSLSAFLRKFSSGSVRKARSSTKRKHREGTLAWIDALSRDSYGVSRDVSMRVQKYYCGMNQNSNDIQKESLSGSVQEYGSASTPEIAEEIVRSSNDGRSIVSSEGARVDSLLGLLRRPYTGSNPDPLVKFPTPSNDKLCRQTEGIPEGTTLYNDGLNQSCDGGSEDLVSNLIRESCSSSFLKLPGEEPRGMDGLNQCSNGSSSNMLHGIVEEQTEEITVSCFDGGGLNGPLCEGTPKVNTLDCNNCLNQFSEKTSMELHDQVEKLFSVSDNSRSGEPTRHCDLIHSSRDNLEGSLSSPAQNSSPISKQEVPLPDGGINQLDDGYLKDSRFVQLQTSSFASDSVEKLTNQIYVDGLNQSANISIEDTTSVCTQKVSLAPVTKQIEETSKTDAGLHQHSGGVKSVLPSNDVKKLDFASTLNEKEELSITVDILNKFSDELLMDSSTLIQKSHSACLQIQSSDDASKGPSSVPFQESFVKEAKVAGSQSIIPNVKEIYPDDLGRALESDQKDMRLTAMQRAVRKVRKCRHVDMAYEGDTDWEVLMHGQNFSENNPVIDGDSFTRTKYKSESPSDMLEEAGYGGAAAAVAAGLKAYAAGPVEKIKFKEVLKRRGGLQEYLECRNLILGLWSKDVSRILPLTDCGVSPEDESRRASLIREIYAFLDHRGYINVGIASEKENTKPYNMAYFKFSKENKSMENCGGQAADTEDEVAYILGQAQTSENLAAAENNISFEDEKPTSVPNAEAMKSKKLIVPSMGLKSSNLVESGECRVVNLELDNRACVACVSEPHGNEKIVVTETCSDWTVQEDGTVPNKTDKLDTLSVDPLCDIVDGGPTAFVLEHVKPSCGKYQSIDINRENVMHVEGSGTESAGINPLEVNCSIQGDLEVSKRIIVIGAGPAGLTAARHLQRQGFSVDVLEARNRIGGRVYTDYSSLSVPVDLGASIITGVEADVATERRPDPSSLLCAQLGLELTVLNSDCPLYDIVTGQKVPGDLDEALEVEYNGLLDDMVVLVAQRGEGAMRMSLEEGLEYALKNRHMARSTAASVESDFGNLDISMKDFGDTRRKNGASKKFLDDSGLKDDILSPLERRVMDWHFANLEYGCAALLKAVSLPYWNQDDVYGGFGGPHCMIKGGYSTVVESLGQGLRIHLNHVVAEITYGMKDRGGTDGQRCEVKVSTFSGTEFVGDAVLITVPLGCLKANTIKFSPPLPEWKQSSIQRLGFGVLNKVVLEFPEVFWDDTVDYFGATAEETECRGRCFMFWNVKKTVGAPVLIALVVGKAAIDGENMSTSDHVGHALRILRKLFGEASVPDPVASVVTNWGLDPFSQGAYSYVAVGASGEDYDILGRPVENSLFFAGEATCKEHPDTVGGAMVSGLREAVRMIEILNTGSDYMSEVEAMVATQRQSDGERNEVRDMVKRLDAVELSNVLCKSSYDGAQRLLTKEALLRDMFSSAKTTAGRLHLAKELLHLPVEALKSFAGTKGGLCTLNSWILDSMGKDGTQLLRHCVRLLVLVSTDLLAVRLSGIGRTVKEKVCVHTSRDIRAIASQLVNIWIEVFRKEKAFNCGSKLLRQSTTSDSSKVKSKDLGSGKTPTRTISHTSDTRGNWQVPSSAGNRLPSNANIRKVDCVKLETLTDAKSEVNSSLTHYVTQNLDSKVGDNVVVCEEEAAAVAAAEAARAAALAAAEAFASSEAECSKLRELPKIPSFQKFVAREQHVQIDDSDLRRRKSSAGVLGRQDCISEVDSRNCKVRNWSVDFSTACSNFDNSRMSGDNYTERSYSNDILCPLNLKVQSGESGAVKSWSTKAWIDSADSGRVKDYHSIERWKSQAVTSETDFFHPSMRVKDEEDSNKISRLSTEKHERLAEGSSVSQVAENNAPVENQPRTVHIKQAAVDYVASLLLPLYKARKIDKDGYKSIMKKSATKVMDHCTEAEKNMTVSEFLDFKRRNKIRSFVDKLIERHMAMNPNVKP